MSSKNYYFSNPERFYSEFSLEAIFGTLIESLIELATVGVVVNGNSEQHQVLLVCGALIGIKIENLPLNRNVK